MDEKLRYLEDLLIIGNICKLNTWVHLGFLYLFMHLLKFSLYIKVTFPSKPEFYQMSFRQIISRLAY